MWMAVHYCSRARATSRNPAEEVLLRSHVTLLQGKAATFTKRELHIEHQVALLPLRLHLRVVLICRALLSILAPMSSMLFPLRSTFLRHVLLPRALTRMVPRERSRESVSDSDCRAWWGRGGPNHTSAQKMRKHLLPNPVTSVSVCLLSIKFTP